MAKLFLDICLSDIPKEHIKTAQNGKKYLKALIAPRKEADRDGYDHFVAVYVPKDIRSEGDRPLFIGRAQDKAVRDAEKARLYNTNEETDLPF